jgi:hypothetical protein
MNWMTTIPLHPRGDIGRNEEHVKLVFDLIVGCGDLRRAFGTLRPYLLRGKYFVTSLQHV